MSSSEPPSTCGPATPIFVVTAYRHGELNNHLYTVYVGMDRAAALHEATEEHDGRGLKYGVEVVGYPSGETIAYLPSYAEAKDATGPTESAERQAAAAIGGRILTAHNLRTSRDPLDPLLASMLDVPELPEWLRQMCEDQLALMRGRQR